MPRILCPNCNRMVEAGPFCQNCSSPLSSALRTRPLETAPTNTMGEPKALTTKTLVILAVVLMVLLFAMSRSATLAGMVIMLSCVGIILGLIALLGVKLTKIGIKSSKAGGVVLASSIGLFIVAASIAPNVSSKRPQESGTLAVASSGAPPPQPPPIRDPAIPQPSPSATVESRPVSSEAAEHLAKAKKALDDGYKPVGKDRSWGRVGDAKASLLLIKPVDKEYREAKKLLREVERRELEIEKWEKVVAAKSAERSSGSQSGVKYYTNSEGNRVQSPVRAKSAPAGATAECRDGTFSFSQNRRGTCSHHGGVKRWL